MRPVILALTLIAWTGSGSYTVDNSDWWSLFEGRETGCSTARKERPSGANFVIAGVDLQHGDPIRDAEEKVAKPSVVVERGDASTGRAQVCFKSASEGGRFKLIFEEGEVASSAYLIDGGPSWTGSDKCVESRKISRNLATVGGLHLGMTIAEVETILGKPCIESNDGIEYRFESEHWLTSKERQRIREGGAGEIDPDEPFGWFGTVRIRFRVGKAYYIAILAGEAQ
jgi:hypothetical protein